MREYTEFTVDRICALNPHRVLEIGCGAGLIMFPLLHRCDAYTGTDLSRARIDSLRALHSDPALQLRVPGLAKATFECRAANDCDWLEPHAYDTVVLPSVIQYFPSVSYLLEVLHGLFNRALLPGGSVFIGDVRNLLLQEAYHASVQLYKADSEERAAVVADRVRNRLNQEHELTVHPSFFLGLREYFPQIRQIEILPKRGSRPNEMWRFRYDVLIRTAGEFEPVSSLSWLDWRANRPAIEALRERLSIERPLTLALRRIANSRVTPALTAARLLLHGSDFDSADDIKRLSAFDKDGLEPEELLRLGGEHNYSVDLSVAAAYPDGSYDAVFRRMNGCDLPLLSWDRRFYARPLTPLANSPMHEKLRRRLSPALRNSLERKLPDYMVPSTFVLLDGFPLTPSGKLDRKALPAPESHGLVARYAPPSNADDVLLCDLVAELLGLDRTGLADNFFHLGGDSISSIRLVSRARERGLHITPRDVFLHPVLGELAGIARSARPQKPLLMDDIAEGLLRATPIIQRLLKESGAWTDFHQSMLLQTPERLDETILLSALQYLLDHHDVLRLRVEAGGNLMIPPAGTIRAADCLQQVSLAGRDPADCFDVLCRSLDAAVARLNPSAGVLLQAVWAGAEPGKRGRLLLVIHHLAVDGVSWRHLGI